MLDTNVLVSGIFFGGVPGKILEAWRDHVFTLVVSQEILGEYAEVGARLGRKFSGIDFSPILALIVSNSELVHITERVESVCDDPDDDKFLACALSGDAGVVVSGDRALRRTSNFRDIQVLTPRQFVNHYLTAAD